MKKLHSLLVIAVFLLVASSSALHGMKNRSYNRTKKQQKQEAIDPVKRVMLDTLAGNFLKGLEQQKNEREERAAAGTGSAAAQRA